MKFLAIEKSLSGASAEASGPLLREEAARVWSLHREGVIRELYFRADRREAVLVLEARDGGEANEVLATLPLVRENLVAFEVIPLVPYSGFERLFTDSGRERPRGEPPRDADGKGGVTQG